MSLSSLPLRGYTGNIHQHEHLHFVLFTYQTSSLALCRLFLMYGKNPLALRRAQFDSFHSPVPTVYTDPLWAATLYPG